MPRKRVEELIDGLSANALAAAPWIFELWGRVDHQLAPSTSADEIDGAPDCQTPWSVWVVLGGRGSGKTRAGSEWVRSQVEGARPEDPGRCRRVALVAETADQARDVMVLGESGLLAVTPPDRRPIFQSTRRRLLWPNGAQAHLFSAADPESLRGPQFDAAWSDELGKWRRAQAAWDMLQLGLRLGEHARQIVTTTPRRNATLFQILEDPATVTTTAATSANRAFLAPDFLDRATRQYGGTALGRQELEGRLLFDAPGALWRWDDIAAARALEAPPLDRVVVAVDPPATSHAGSDACGIIVAAAAQNAAPSDRRAVVLADVTVQGARPQEWAERVVAAYREHSADRIVAEVNQGGDLVESVLRQVDPSVAFRAVRATRGKRARAEPIAALYEQRRVAHGPGLDALEEEMCAFSRIESAAGRSPDRVDALVWALTELMLEGAGARPRVRRL